MEIKAPKRLDSDLPIYEEEPLVLAVRSQPDKLPLSFMSSMDSDRNRRKYDRMESSLQWTCGLGDLAPLSSRDCLQHPQDQGSVPGLNGLPADDPTDGSTLLNGKHYRCGIYLVAGGNSQ